MAEQPDLGAILVEKHNAQKALKRAASNSTTPVSRTGSASHANGPPTVARTFARLIRTDPVSHAVRVLRMFSYQAPRCGICPGYSLSAIASSANRRLASSSDGDGFLSTWMPACVRHGVPPLQPPRLREPLPCQRR